MIKTYAKVWVALILLLGLTIGMAFVNLGSVLSPLANLTIAIIKAVLVILFFMHIGRARGITRVFAGAGFFWLLILFSLTMSDYLTRGWLPSSEHW